MADEGDIDGKRAGAQPHDEIATRLQRASAVQLQQSRASVNASVPKLQYDTRGRRFYDTAPRPLRRLLGSPLVQAGKYARGPNRERQIGGSWGDPRNFSYDPANRAVSIHQGLDFFAPFGEALLACGDGKVTFAGYQSRTGAVQVSGARQNAQGQIFDAKGQLVADKNQVGFGGIAIHIVHNGDFENYRTEYYHLSSIAVSVGQTISEGTIIGAVGNTGLSIGPHLHFQIAYVAGKTSAIVNPTAMVPNYKPGHVDSTNSIAAKGVLLPPLATAGLQVSSSQAANTVNALDRATSMQNQDVAAVRQAQAGHSARIAQTIDVQQSALYAAAASFQGASPVVTAPMVFDFATGTWSDGKVT